MALWELTTHIASLVGKGLTLIGALATDESYTGSSF